MIPKISISPVAKILLIISIVILLPVILGFVAVISPLVFLYFIYNRTCTMIEDIHYDRLKVKKKSEVKKPFDFNSIVSEMRKGNGKVS